MKFLTTLEVARQLGVSKQTVLNWLYAGRVPEPPRNKKGYRLWSLSRLNLVKRLVQEGRLNKRTVLFREAAGRPEIVTEYAREVSQFLRENGMNAEAFLKELARFSPEAALSLPQTPADRKKGKGSRDRQLKDPGDRRSKGSGGSQLKGASGRRLKESNGSPPKELDEPKEPSVLRSKETSDRS